MINCQPKLNKVNFKWRKVEGDMKHMIEIKTNIKPASTPLLRLGEGQSREPPLTN